MRKFLAARTQLASPGHRCRAAAVGAPPSQPEGPAKDGIGLVVLVPTGLLCQDRLKREKDLVQSAEARPLIRALEAQPTSSRLESVLFGHCFAVFFGAWHCVALRLRQSLPAIQDDARGGGHRASLSCILDWETFTGECT